MNMLEQEDPKKGRRLILREVLRTQFKDYIVGDHTIRAVQATFAFWVESCGRNIYGDAGDYIVESGGLLSIYPKRTFEDECVEV